MVDTQAHVDEQAAAVDAEPTLAEVAQAEPQVEPTIVFQHVQGRRFPPPQWAGALQKRFGVHRNAAPSHVSTSLNPHVK